MTRSALFLLAGLATSFGLAGAGEPSPDAGLRAETKALRSLLRRASYEDVADITTRLAAFSDAAAIPLLQVEARSGRTVRKQRVAIAELGRRRAQAAERTLARIVVRAGNPRVREDARAALATLPSDAGAAAFFAEALGDPKRTLRERMRAVQAVRVHPAAAAVPGMLRLLRQTASGGRVHFARGQQRAYIQDVEVDQTGVIPVLQPKIGRLQTGVALETKVIFYVRETLIWVLEETTGQKHGADLRGWDRWWRTASDGFQPRRPRGPDEKAS